MTSCRVQRGTVRGTSQPQTEEGEDGLLRRGEGSLAGGLALLGVAGFLAPQMMLGLLALALTPVVLALLFAGAWRVRDPDLERLSRHPAYAPPERRPLVTAACWLAPVFLGMGLYCRAGWSPWRCLFWAGVVWVFPYGMARLIQTCGPSMVLSA